MRFSRMVNVVGVHAEGELNEVITGGVLDVPGRSMFAKARWLETQGDALRQFLLHEPRGKVTQCVNLVLPSAEPEAVAAFADDFEAYGTEQVGHVAIHLAAPERRHGPTTDLVEPVEKRAVLPDQHHGDGSVVPENARELAERQANVVGAQQFQQIAANQ